MDMASGGAVFFSMAYAFAGLIGGTFSKHGRLMFLVSYIIANTVAVLWTWGASLRVELMYEVFAATVIFALLPDSLLEYVGGIAQLPVPGTGIQACLTVHAWRVLVGLVQLVVVRQRVPGADGDARAASRTEVLVPDGLFQLFIRQDCGL
jgi:hypothetical protein